MVDCTCFCFSVKVYTFYIYTCYFFCHKRKSLKLTSARVSVYVVWNKPTRRVLPSNIGTLTGLDGMSVHVRPSGEVRT